MRTIALLYKYLDKLKHRVFTNTFREDTQLWFNQLSPKCIRSFSQFQDLFMHQFNNSKCFRFTAAIPEVLGAHKEVLANSFINGLAKGPFFAALVTNPTEDYDKLMANAEKFINFEKAVKIKKANRNKRKVPKSQVLIEIKASILLRQSFRANQGPTKPKSDKFCKFHNDYEHDTDECAHLRNEIEKLIKKCHIKEFLANLRVAASHHNNSGAVVGRRVVLSPQAHQKKGLIHMISGRPMIGDSTRSKRAHATQRTTKISRLEVNNVKLANHMSIILFSPIDLKGMDYPY
ncbi:hypothetical protein CDL12_09137 [Handroanthus impetiginosus]|uniref:Retrotransposon gag domain-containing protein n=1 Tax=Handroanthus impetiginosus TaxID=429701 RepID=A0A2G9HKY5_9LAMI|nr:hypothetical protein CDL12_09137 [Handroanthus impetiginosus]